MSLWRIISKTNNKFTTESSASVNNFHKVEVFLQGFGHLNTVLEGVRYPQGLEGVGALEIVGSS